MRDRIRDAILIMTVGASLVGTGWAFHDPAETRPADKVQSTPAPAEATDPHLH